jgi:GntR family transcriptional regulator
LINKFSNVPLYSQLKNLVIEKIQSGEYPEESQIPSEQELCEAYDISRPTVRQAISELTSSGYLYKEKGKGTFVSRSKRRLI